MRTGESDILMCALEGQVGGSAYRRGQHGATIHGGGHVVPRGWRHQHGARWLPPSPALRSLGRRGAPPRVGQPQLTAGEKKKKRPASTTKNNAPGPHNKKCARPPQQKERRHLSGISMQIGLWRATSSYCRARIALWPGASWYFH